MRALHPDPHSVGREAKEKQDTWPGFWYLSVHPVTYLLKKNNLLIFSNSSPTGTKYAKI